MIDIGVNLSNSRFSKDVEETLDRAQQAGVETLILTGTSIEESRAVLTLCQDHSEAFPGMLYATAGIHPHDASTLNRESIGILRELAAQPQVVAIGEMGLDFNRNFSTPAEQEKAFEAQLELAVELQLPVFLHERDAAVRQLQILKSYRDHLVDAVTHCFTGSKQALFGYLDLNMHISITGWVCDEKRGQALQQLVSNIPLERLMVETDAPYLLPKNKPEPPKGKRNEPAFLPWVIEGITKHRDESAEQIAISTAANALRFFRLDKNSK
jgi:TatD DNase family protein